MVDTKINYGMILRRYDAEAENNDSPEAIAAKMLPADADLKSVASAVLYMKFKEVGPAVTAALKNKEPLDIINNGLVAGMEIVCLLYAQHVYYLPEIMMAAKVMEVGIAIAEKQVPGGRATKGTMVMHAAEGDPHDIGKNIAAVVMRAAGYTVVDLGKDVPVDEVVECVKAEKPFMVSGTALMTTTMTVQKDIMQPRLPSYKLKKATESRGIQMFTLQDMEDTDEHHYGLNGSPTQVQRIFPPTSDKVQQKLEGTTAEMADQLYRILKKKKFTA